MKLLPIGIIIGGAIAFLPQAQADSCSWSGTTCSFTRLLITDPTQFSMSVAWPYSTSVKYQDFDNRAISPLGEAIDFSSSAPDASIDANQYKGGTPENITAYTYRQGTYYYFVHATKDCNFAGSNVQTYGYHASGLTPSLNADTNGQPGSAANTSRRFYQTFAITNNFDPSTGVVTRKPTTINKFTTGPLRIPGPSGNQNPMTGIEAGTYNYKVELRSFDHGTYGYASVPPAGQPCSASNPIPCMQTAYHSFLTTPWGCVVSEVTPACTNPKNTAQTAKLVTETVNQRDIQYVLLKSTSGSFSHYVRYDGPPGARSLPDARVYTNVQPTTQVPYIAPLAWIAGQEPDFHGQLLPGESATTAPRVRKVGLNIVGQNPPCSPGLTGLGCTIATTPTYSCSISSTVKLPYPAGAINYTTCTNTGATSTGAACTATCYADDTNVPAAPVNALGAGAEYTTVQTTFDQTMTEDWHSFTITASAAPRIEDITVVNAAGASCSTCVSPAAVYTP